LLRKRANLREVSYGYAGMELSLGWSCFRCGNAKSRRGRRFDPHDVSPPEHAVAQRAFPVLLFCGTLDRRIPCRHSEQICRAARGTCAIWKVTAGHMAMLETDPGEYEERVIGFLAKH